MMFSMCWALILLTAATTLQGSDGILLSSRRVARAAYPDEITQDEVRCYECAERLRNLVNITDGELMKEITWVRDVCNEGREDYECLQSEACLRDPHRDTFIVKIHENFCNNVEGVVALAVCWEDPGLEATSRSCNEDMEPLPEEETILDPDGAAPVSVDNYACRSMRQSSDCMMNKAKKCPASAQRLLKGEMDIFLPDFCA